MGQRPATGQTSGLLGTAARDAWLARRSGRQRWARPLAALTGAGLVTLSILASGGSSALGAVVAASSGSDFNPVSVTFVSLRAGWALGSAPCGRSSECLSLRETLDGGRTWAARPLPAALEDAADRQPGGGLALNVSGCCGQELNVRFADRRDGWIYGGLFVPGQFPSTVSIEPVLWSTRNGGLSWRPVRSFPALVPESPIFDLEAAAGRAYAMVDATAVSGSYGAMIESSPVATDSWRAASSLTLSGPSGGSQPFGAIVLQGNSGWAVYGNDRGTSGSAQLDGQGPWVAWSPPCASVGDSYAVPAASTAANLVAICVMGGFGGYVATGSAPRGATSGSTWLYFSDNGGRTFQAGPELGRFDNYSGQVASPAPGVVLASGYGTPGDLEASFDGGHHWAAVYRGGPFYLGFTSPAQGVGLVQSSRTTTTMIMTFDGGHHWAPVTF